MSIAAMAVTAGQDITDIVGELNEHPKENPLSPADLFVLGYAVSVLAELAARVNQEKP